MIITYQLYFTILTVSSEIKLGVKNNTARRRASLGDDVYNRPIDHKKGNHR
jgi:hypothetical protein